MLTKRDNALQRFPLSHYEQLKNNIWKQMILSNIVTHYYK